MHSGSKSKRNQDRNSSNFKSQHFFFIGVSEMIEKLWHYWHREDFNVLITVITIIKWTHQTDAA